MSDAPQLSLTRADVRDIDHRAATVGHLPIRVLMENAGRGAAEVLVRLGATGPIVVVCGKGNNGGDGLVMARHLASWGRDVRVLLAASPTDLSEASQENWHALLAANVPARVLGTYDDDEFDRAAWIVDAILGIGLTSPARPPLDQLIASINASPANVFAIDIPSGLDADTGEALGATILARHTATFVAPKRGFENPASLEWTGRVHVVDIGLGSQAPRLLPAAGVLLPTRNSRNNSIPPSR